MVSQRALDLSKISRQMIITIYNAAGNNLKHVYKTNLLAKEKK
jgi:hypothetical protein